MLRRDSYHAAILPATAAHELVEDGGRAFVVSREAVERIEAGLLQQLATARTDPRRYLGPDATDEEAAWLAREIDVIVPQLSRYRRQYAGYVMADGSSRVYANFLSPFSGAEPDWGLGDWQNELIVVQDGGTDYWYAVFDLTTLRVIHIRVNGEG